MRYAFIPMLVFAGLMSCSCATIIKFASKEGLKDMPPTTRAEYRNGLDIAAEAYDGLYDREGMPLVKEEPSPEDEGVVEPAPSE